jgi:hypothetical protein
MAEIRAGDISDQSHHDEIRVEDSDGACDCSLVVTFLMSPVTPRHFMPLGR